MSLKFNTTINGTQLSSCYNPTAEKIGKTFAYCLILVVSLLGNSFIGIIVYKTKTMRRPINFIIVNMAVCDLLCAIFLFPVVLTELYVGSWVTSGPLGLVLCKFVAFFLTTVSATVSIQSLVLIAVDRFGAVVFPFRSPLISSKLCPFFILATWIIAIAVWSPYLFAYKLVEYPGGPACTLQWNEVFGESSSHPNYILAINVVFFYTPLVLLLILYTIVYSKLKSQVIPGEQSVNARQQHARRERNVLKMANAIVLGFAVCWLPLSFAWILLLFVSDIWSCDFQYFWSFAIVLAHSNCAINPCICFIFSENYRQALKNLRRCF